MTKTSMKVPAVSVIQRLDKLHTTLAGAIKRCGNVESMLLLDELTDFVSEWEGTAKKARQAEVGPFELFIPPTAPPSIDLGERTLAALQNMIFMALPRPIVVLPTDTKPSDEIKLDGGLNTT